MRIQNFSLFPKFIFKILEDVSPDFLKSQGIKFVMLDIDNTIASYDEHVPSDPVRQWFEDIRSNDINPFLISNSTNDERVKAFAGALGVSFIMYARKPLPNALYRAMGMANVSAQESALIGDQVFTDTLAANLANVTPIIVHPRKLTNPFFAIRYFIELPFRRRGKLIISSHNQNTEETNDERNHENH